MLARFLSFFPSAVTSLDRKARRNYDRVRVVRVITPIHPSRRRPPHLPPIRSSSFSMASTIISWWPRLPPMPKGALSINLPASTTTARAADGEIPRMSPKRIIPTEPPRSRSSIGHLSAQKTSCTAGLYSTEHADVPKEIRHPRPNKCLLCRNGDDSGNPAADNHGQDAGCSRCGQTYFALPLNSLFYERCTVCTVYKKFYYS